MSETDATQLSDDDVYGILSSISEYNIVNIEMPTGSAIWFTFDGEGYNPTRYTFEVNIYSGNLWLHEHTDDGGETVWENKRRR